MLINLSELFPAEGKSKTYRVPLEMESFSVSGGTYPVVRREPVELVIENQGDRVFSVKGRAVLGLSIPCARCLEPVEVPFDLAIDLELDMKKTGEEREAELDEQFYIDG